MAEQSSPSSPPPANNPRHTAVVLFYKYFPTKEFPTLYQYGSLFEQRFQSFARDLCYHLQLKGRLLISTEGVNGTVSAVSMEVIDEFIRAMEGLEVVRDLGLPEADNLNNSPVPEFPFQNVDWKKSYSSASDRLPEPFPDLKVSIVKEIISTGGGVSVDELSVHGGKHLEPHEFHRLLEEEGDQVVLIDVRNTFECEIGHFVNPQTHEKAVNPEIVKFSMFDDTFCAKQVEALKDKKVLMYCTGGIRCEKASVMLKRRGINDVSQLKGGIHRYLEEYGNEGYFRGMNFVFDQRVAMTPSECQKTGADDNKKSTASHEVVGKCLTCETPYDELSGDRICTVCRDPVLVCPACESKLREYHCRRHWAWRHCYFTFLEVFPRDELVQQRAELLKIRDSLTNRNMRRTLMRQVEKVDERVRNLDQRIATVDPRAPRRCRTCMESGVVCDGNCWGFWKTDTQRAPNDASLPLFPVQIGDMVEPGPHWNALRLGTPYKESGDLRCGKVVEVKSWGSGGSHLDSVAVQWDLDSIPTNRRADRVPQIYRWGSIALDGTRMYDVQKKEGCPFPA